MGRERRLNAGHSSSSHFDGIACCSNTRSHLLHWATTGTKRMNLVALRLPLRCGDTCGARQATSEQGGAVSGAVHAGGRLGKEGDTAQKQSQQRDVRPLEAQAIREDWSSSIWKGAGALARLFLWRRQPLHVGERGDERRHPLPPQCCR